MHLVHSFGTGGTEAGIRKVLAGLDVGRFEQTVCTVLAGPSKDPETGVRITSLGRTPGRSGWLFADYYRVFSRERPDIVHARNWGTIEAVPAARLARVRSVIYSEHGLDVRTAQRQPWRRNAFRRLCFRWADRVFAVSRGLSDYFVRQLRILPDQLPVLANGVDTERFRPDPAGREEIRRELGLSNDAVVIGTVSRLDPVKDHRTLLRAAQILVSEGCPLQVIVVGDGPERLALEREVAAIPLLCNRVRFAGESREVPRWLHSFDLFVLPSLAEGMSNTLLEAMASGVAVIASGVGGNPEIIEEGKSGLLFDAGDAYGLAARMKALIVDSDRRQKLARGARQRVEGAFRIQDMLESYTRLYESVCCDQENAARGIPGLGRWPGRVRPETAEATRKVQ